MEPSYVRNGIKSLLTSSQISIVSPADSESDYKCTHYVKGGT